MTKEITRDSYGLRDGTKATRIRPIRNTYRSDEEFEKATKRCQKLSELWGKTKSLRDAMDLNHFASVSLDRISRLIANDCSEVTVVPGPAPLTAFDEEAKILRGLERELSQVEQRLRHIGPENELLLTLLHRVNLVKITTDAFEDQIDAPLYRYHSILSQSKRRDNLGIVCPGWRKGESGDTRFTEDHVCQHLTKGDISSPPFISVSDSPGRIYRIMLADRRHGRGPGKIIIMSRRMLQKLAVDFWPSTAIVHDFGLKTHSSKNPKGLHYVTESHVLVHRWVPEECIKREWSEGEFETFCAVQGVTSEHPGMTSSYPCYFSGSICFTVIYENIDVKKRPSFEDISDFKPISFASRRVYVGFADDDTPDHADDQQPDIEDRLNELALS